MSDLKREDSFRSELKKQKRRLSATKLPARVEAEPAPTPADLVDLRCVVKKQYKSSHTFFDDFFPEILCVGEFDLNMTLFLLLS